MEPIDESEEIELRRVNSSKLNIYSYYKNRTTQKEEIP